VLPISASPALIQKIKIDAKGEGLLLGEGYGNWKGTSFRVANFPAINAREITTLMKFLKKY
jgi:phosphoserine aminotransferase